MKPICRLFCAGALQLLSVGCVSTAGSNFYSLLWMQSSAEYRANATLVYRAAMEHMDAALLDSSWTAAKEQDGDCSKLPPAVIMDIDETVLDNSRYMGKVVLENGRWSPDTWNEWVSLKEATAVPGAVAFIEAMKKKNVAVIFISNRECGRREGSESGCAQEADTIENLAKIGVSGVRPENVLLKGEREDWTSEKTSRREAVAKNYRIVMLFGDDLGDFLPDVKKNITPQERDRLVSENSGHWGRKWFVLPNPTYGSWLDILHDPKSQYIRGF
ncbi:acid phosphatase [Prosthecochloris sp. GSB1]|uniref:5'-nucleotidase, lipoprotein e(P4) family n=1 Tax=Prosthecochloris sp. GSB1 TaxID=281093 RepID=UPI000B8CAF5B|nr:HAD family acid phosphatase [Prosthecochloris sp. GSB1]ASQ90456.1 acid phosphatase [Prosthecochloris sp. GSB1]